MEQIKPTSDRKVRFYKAQQNSFGLLPGSVESGGTCPGCTTGPGGCWYLAPGRKTHTCYVDGLMTAYKGVRAILAHNTQILKDASLGDMIEILDNEFTRFETAETARAARTGEQKYLRYRLHWSGDVFSRQYAAALRTAMTAHPDIQFWTYTRSFEYADSLLANNLTLYLSLDPRNIQEGIKAYLRNKWDNNPRVQICYMSKTHDFHTLKAYDSAYMDMKRSPTEASNIRMVPCPVDAGKMPLEGGCAKCRRCVYPGNGAVWFKT